MLRLALCLLALALCARCRDNPPAGFYWALVTVYWFLNYWEWRKNQA